MAKKAEKDAEKLRKSEPAAYQKLLKLIEELKMHPRSGTAHPEPLKGNLSGYYSRRLTHKHRVVYKIIDDKVLVLLLSAYSHYNDK